MPFVPLRKFGTFGVIHDTQAQALPTGAWTDARNVRFSGIEMEKMLEPTLAMDLDGIEGDVQWMQGWSDGLSTYVAVATSNDLWFYQAASATTGSWVNATREVGGAYSPDSKWSSFEWGDTVIFNNGGYDKPQIFNPSTLKFEDLPKWGFISTADDIFNDAEPSRDVDARCKFLAPMGNFLVAVGTTESISGYQPNTVWWSDATTLSTYEATIDGGGPPSWDYESPATLSGKRQVGVGDGPLKTAALLNDNLILYCESSANAMQLVGGTAVMDIRRLFNKGAAGQHCVCEFNNLHFVLSTSQLYTHDGSTVNLLGKDRVEDELFIRLGKGGRYGGDGTIEWDGVQVVKNPLRKEIYVIYNEIEKGYEPDPPPIPEPTVCKEYECDAYENALIASSATAIWPMNAGGPGSGIIPSIRDEGALSAVGADSSITPQLLPDACASGSVYYFPYGAYAVSSANTYGSANFTLLVLINNAENGFMNMAYNYGTGQQVTVDRVVATDSLRIRINDPNSVQEIYEYPGAITSGTHSVILSYQDGIGFDVYVDFLLVGREENTLSVYATTAPRLFVCGLNGSTAEENYLAYWPTNLLYTEIAELQDAYNQNFVGYKDPFPGCVDPTIAIDDVFLPPFIDNVTFGDQPLCKQYECDALYNQLVSSADHVWTHFQATPEPGEAPTNRAYINDEVTVDSGWRLYQFSSPLGGGAVIDTCPGEGAASISAAGGWVIGDTVQGLPSAVIDHDKGSFGAVYGAPTGTGGSFVRIEFSAGGGGSSVSLVQSGSDLTIGMAGNVGVSGTADEVYAGEYIANSYYHLDFTWDDASYTCELYRNFVSLGSRSGSVDSRVTPNTPYIRYGLINGNFGVITQLSTYSVNPFTAQELSALAAAWEQNKSTYVDPNPNCQEVCKQYECDSYESALIASTASGLWFMTEDAVFGNPTIVPAVRTPGGAGDDTDMYAYNVASTQPVGTQMLEDSCAGGHAYNMGQGAFMETTHPNTFYATNAFTMGTFIRESGVGALVYSSRYAVSEQVRLDCAGDTLSVNIRHPDKPDEEFTYAGVIPNNLTSGYPNDYIAIAYTRGVSFSVYVNWVLIATETGIETLDFDDDQGFGCYGDVNKNTQNSHVAYWPSAISASEVSTLRSALLQNNADYVDPDPNCVEAP